MVVAKISTVLGLTACKCVECTGSFFNEKLLFDKCSCDVCIGSGEEEISNSVPSSLGNPFQPCTCVECQQQVDSVEILRSTHVFQQCNCLDCREDRLFEKCTCFECVGTVFSACQCAICTGISNEKSNVSGGFRVIQDGKVTIVDNLCEDSSVCGPLTELQDFYIKAHSVVKSTGVPNYVQAKIEVPSALNISECESNLVDYEDKNLVQFLKYGFPLGYASSNLPVSKPKNHSGALEFPVVIDEYLESEIGCKNVLGPFQSNPLSETVFVSPLNSVEKKDSRDRRIIADFSYPPGTSINDGIDKNLYLGDVVDLSYPSVDNFAFELKKNGTRYYDV